jgi:hypothetical protein
MNHSHKRPGQAALWALLVASAAGCNNRTSQPPPIDVYTQPVADIKERVHTFCGDCHPYPPPDTFPRDAWQLEVERGYRFFSQSGRNLEAPPMDEVVKYYEERAPKELPAAQFETATTPLPVEFEKMQVPAVAHAEPPAISNVNLVHLFNKDRLDVLVCDMRRGQVLVYQPYEAKPTWKILSDKVSNPAHTEVKDLDGDGIKDILVANLGSYLPTDRRCGSVVWLRGNRDGTFTPYTLLENIGRVADVQAADFRGIGKLDLIVAAFGWNDTGEVYYLENQTIDWSKPKFVPRILDQRHGAIHVPIADLNGDKKPDFVALFAQEHETIVAFLNDGKGGFTKKELYSAPHPAYGSSGIQLVDINGDGKVDILYTNGDTLDVPYLLKPYHSIQWLENKSDLENKGDLKFEHHPITPMYGVHRAVAADFKGTGKKLKDIVAVCFLPKEAFPKRKELNLDAVIYLEQVAPGQFVRRSMETVTCNHVTCVAGDLYGQGRMDLVTGNFTTSTEKNLGLTIWKNLRLAAPR